MNVNKQFQGSLNANAHNMVNTHVPLWSFALQLRSPTRKGSKHVSHVEVNKYQFFLGDPTSCESITDFHPVKTIAGDGTSLIINQEAFVPTISHVVPTFLDNADMSYYEAQIRTKEQQSDDGVLRVKDLFFYDSIDCSGDVAARFFIGKKDSVEPFVAFDVREEIQEYMMFNVNKERTGDSASGPLYLRWQSFRATFGYLQDWKKEKEKEELEIKGSDKPEFEKLDPKEVEELLKDLDHIGRYVEMDRDREMQDGFANRNGQGPPRQGGPSNNV